MNYYSMNANEIQRVIVAEARECFLRDGYAATDIKKIANRIQLSRSALYRYFPRKETLALHVMRELMTEIYQDAMDYSNTLNGSGWSKYRTYTVHYLENLMDKPSLIVFISDFDRAFIGDYDEAGNGYVDAIHGLMDFDRRMVEAGQRDGSIRADLSASMLSSVVVNATAGIVQRVCPRSAHIETEHGNVAHEIVRRTTDLLFLSIKKESEGIKI